MDIKGKLALVTGAGSGMGAQTARFLAEKGAKVVLMDLNLNAAWRIADEINGFSIKADVADSEAVENALREIQAKLGTPKICVNCAGIAPARRIIGTKEVMPLADFEEVISVNLTGTFNVLRLSAALMSELELEEKGEERGVIINTASIAAFEGQVGQSAYSASKGGICAMTLPAARELSEWNIRVVTIAPGLIETPLLGSLHQDIKDRLASNIVFPHRLGYPNEFAMLVCHIIENPYINGEIIRLDGGLRMQSK
jgi:NAD(P)-dependent dehydrogenase (short-subunit alcohol dehydrogenase family)